MNRGQQPPASGNVSTLTKAVVTITVLFTLALATYGLRVGPRIRPRWRLTSVDYVITSALVCETIVFTSTMVAVSFGFGHPSYYNSDADEVRILKCIYVVALFGSLAAPIARISIGVMLLRFQLVTSRKLLLWILIFIQVAIGVTSSLVMFLQCNPIRVFWEPVKNGKCWSNASSRNYGYAAASVGLCSDVIFAVMPISFIWSLKVPLIERVLLIVLMGFGISAATAGAMKVYYIRTWKYGEEAVRETLKLHMWYRVEEINLITSSCAPFLKGPIERMISRFGIKWTSIIPLSLRTYRAGTHAAATTETPREPWTAQPFTRSSVQQLTRSSAQYSIRSSTSSAEGAPMASTEHGRNTCSHDGQEVDVNDRP